MGDYNSVCSVEIKDLGMNEAEVALLKSQLDKKGDALSNIKSLDEQINRNISTKDANAQIKTLLSSNKNNNLTDEEIDSNNEKIQSLRANKKDNAEIRKLRATYNKTLNDVHDEVLSDYQRYAKDDVTQNISTLRRRMFLDRIHKTPSLLKKILFVGSEADKNSLHAQYHIEKQEFGAYTSSYQHLKELEDPNLDVNDYSHESIKKAVKYLRDFINQKNLESLGKLYYEDDLEHSVNFNRDTLHNNIDEFVNDIKLYTDNEKFMARIKDKDDGVIGFDDAAEESAVGASKEQFRNKDINSALEDWKSAVLKGVRPNLSLNKLPFKDDDSFQSFTAKWARNDPVTNYTDFIGSTFLKNHVSNLTFGGQLRLESLPSEAFTNLGKINAQGLYDTFMNYHEMTSQKFLGTLNFLKNFKSLVLAGKNAMLTLWQFTDRGTGVFIEATKNSNDNLATAYGNFFKNMVGDYREGIKTNARIAKSMAESIFKINEKKQFGKLHEVFNSYDEYQGIARLKDIDNQTDNKFFSTIERFNKRMVYDPMHNADNELRNGAWQATINTLNNYDKNIPVGITSRLKRYGINDTDVDEIKRLISLNNPNETLRNGAIENVKNSVLRRKLRQLKLNTDLSTVPMDITPPLIAKITNEPIRQAVNFFWSYHLKLGAQVGRVIWDSSKDDSPLKTAINTVGRLGLVSLYSLPANLAVSSLFTFLWTGQNPFGDKLRDQTIIGGLLGNIYRPLTIAYALASGNSRLLGEQAVNPLITNVASTYEGGKTAIELAAGKVKYVDRTKAYNTMLKPIAELTPFGSEARMGVKAYQNN